MRSIAGQQKCQIKIILCFTFCMTLLEMTNTYTYETFLFIQLFKCSRQYLLHHSQVIVQDCQAVPQIFG